MGTLSLDARKFKYSDVNYADKDNDSDDLTNYHSMWTQFTAL